MWSMLGLFISLALALLALNRSRAAGGFYDSAVYAMTSAAHKRYAWVSLCFALFFVFTLVRRHEDLALWGFAALTLVAIFYLTSFLRGFSDSDV